MLRRSPSPRTARHLHRLANGQVWQAEGHGPDAAHGSGGSGAQRRQRRDVRRAASHLRQARHWCGAFQRRVAAAARWPRSLRRCTRGVDPTPRPNRRRRQGRHERHAPPLVVGRHAVRAPRGPCTARDGHRPDGHDGDLRQGHAAHGAAQPRDERHRAPPRPRRVPRGGPHRRRRGGQPPRVDLRRQ